MAGDATGAKKIFDELLASKTDESIEQRVQSFMATMDIFSPDDFKAAIIAAKNSASETVPTTPEPVAQPIIPDTK